LHITPGPFHLTYCTNIHAADGWEGVYANLKQYATVLKARFSPSAPFGVGLRLSAREASELLEGNRLREFRAFLDREGLYVALINGFPYGPFHGTPVKANVYAPDWRDEARVDYTIDLIRILQALLPEGLDGGVSTAPLSYKAWVAGAGPETWETMTRNVVRVAVALVRIRREHGALIHLDIEPEPDCVLENTEESVVFFEQWLFSVGALMLAASLGINPDEARRHLQDHIRLCFDCCHFAVEYEDPAAALERLRAAGIQIGRVQLSSALHVHFPSDAHAAADVAGRLRPFADTTYLHQVVEQQDEGLRHYSDLDVALGDKSSSAAEWRIHFHVPLFAREYDAFGSTQDYVRKVLGLALQAPFTTHLEIETYTWDVLPPGLKMDLAESIAREYEWVLQTIAGHASARSPDPGALDTRSSSRPSPRASSLSSSRPSSRPSNK
jgi:sugar phosphate isomerase/epimerase